MGSYPGAFPLREDERRWAAYVRDAILEPAICRDILALAAVRRPALLRQVFGVAASSPAQVVSLQKIQGQLQDAGALETIAHYLALLEEAFLVAPLAAFGAPAPLQWILYTVLSLVMLATLRQVVQRRLAARGSGAVDSLVGETATLLEDLPAGGEVKAELRGTPWNARAVDGAAIAKGRRCRVDRVDGLTLWLRAE